MHESKCKLHVFFCLSLQFKSRSAGKLLPPSSFTRLFLFVLIPFLLPFVLATICLLALVYTWWNMYTPAQRDHCCFCCYSRFKASICHAFVLPESLWPAFIVTWDSWSGYFNKRPDFYSVGEGRGVGFYLFALSLFIYNATCQKQAVIKKKKRG